LVTTAKQNPWLHGLNSMRGAVARTEDGLAGRPCNLWRMQRRKNNVKESGKESSRVKLAR
jgi:hypothetical protein